MTSLNVQFTYVFFYYYSFIFIFIYLFIPLTEFCLRIEKIYAKYLTDSFYFF